MKVSEFISGVAVPVVTAATGILVLYLNSHVQSFEGKLKEREQDRLDTVAQGQASQQQVDLRFRIYDAAMKALESNDDRKQQVATSLVISMLETEDPLRSGLLEVLKNHGDEKASQQAEKALRESSQFAQLQPTATPEGNVSQEEWQAYNMDIFWCTATPGNASKAEQVRQALVSAGASGRLRVRELGPTINASPGYRITGLVIRREENEEKVAEDVKKVVDAAAGGSFSLTNSTQGTPGYLSLFVCQ